MNLDVTFVDPIKFVKEVYKLSVPQGLGFLHFEEGGLTNLEAQEILDMWEKDKPFPKLKEEHGISCNCMDCQMERR